VQIPQKTMHHELVGEPRNKLHKKESSNDDQKKHKDSFRVLKL